MNSERRGTRLCRRETLSSTRTRFVRVSETENCPAITPRENGFLVGHDLELGPGSLKRIESNSEDLVMRLV